MPSQDVRKFTPVSYRTLALWGHCPALAPLMQLITPRRALGTADHVRSLDDQLCSGTLLHLAATPRHPTFAPMPLLKYLISRTYHSPTRMRLSRGNHGHLVILHEPRIVIQHSFSCLFNVTYESLVCDSSPIHIPGGCDQYAQCTNTEGSRECECNSGFLGDGITCTDINECIDENGFCR